jgi:hypothetical protein
VPRRRATDAARQSTRRCIYRLERRMRRYAIAQSGQRRARLPGSTRSSGGYHAHLPIQPRIFGLARVRTFGRCVGGPRIFGRARVRAFGCVGGSRIFGRGRGSLVAGASFTSFPGSPIARRPVSWISRAGDTQTRPRPHESRIDPWGGEGSAVDGLANGLQPGTGVVTTPWGCASSSARPMVEDV